MDHLILRLREVLRDTRLWVFALVLSALVYGPELTEFTLSVDEEYHSYYGGPDWTRTGRHGRWGLELLRTVLPDPGTLPFLPTVLFCAGLAFSALLLSRLTMRSRAESFVFVGFFVSSPIWLHVAEFNTISWTMGIALSAIGLAAILAGGDRKRDILVSGLLAGFAVAVYQGLLFLYALIALILMVRNRPFWGGATTVDENRTFRWGPAVSLAISTMMYYSVNSAALMLLDADMIYSRSFVRLKDFESSFSAAVATTASTLSGFLVGSDATFLDWGPAVLGLAWIGILVGLQRLLDHEGATVRSRVVDLLTFGLAILIASVPIIISAGRTPTRSLVAFPFLYALLAANAFRGRIPNSVRWGLFGLAMFVSLWISASLFYSDNLARQRDLVLAARIVDRVEGVGRERFGKAIPTVIIGVWTQEVEGPARRVELFGESFFEHHGGNNARIRCYFRLLGVQDLKFVLGIDDLRLISARHLRNYLDEIHAMPTWPEVGSVAVVGDMVVVKLGPLSYSQKKLLGQ